ncbi:site-specific integrase [Methylobacterium sp. 17Sr1-1]|uniref:tyrosine-type recombinase/integrase n=1 Tax=Methylobacterium sp. 17Sr1-1 TaxID=2202826 RepID=UPI000D6FE5F0|nr:site-specific integrase [Methylobacterium sp. 17Sr1-1]AWN51598.1 integrase [Methylobacterium sp. 17Sr1-1]
MPEYKLQRFRGGWAWAAYEGGKRISRQGLKSRDAASAAAEFARVVAELTRPVDPTVKELWEAYVTHKAGRRIAKNMAASGRIVLPFFGHMKPEDITIKVCRAYIAKRAALGRKNGSIRTEMNQLRTALLWAEKARLITKAPAMEMPPASTPKERHLTRPEFDALLSAASTPHLVLYLHLAIATAGRNAAILELTWDRVNFERNLIYLGVKDALRPRKGRATVPMTDTVRAALFAAKEGARTDHVIEWAGEPVKSVRTALGKAAARAKIAGLSPHVLRHSAAVWMAEDGASMSEIATYLGHSDDKITQRVYAKLSPTHLRRASQALEVGRPRLRTVG